MKKLFPIAFILAIFLMSSCSSLTRVKKINNEKYSLVWHDEFNYKGLPDSSKWNYDVEGNSWNWGNNEEQYYTSKDKDNAEVKKGKLFITAIREEIEGKDYTSARLVTKGKGDWLYGRIEVKAKLPEGRGTWPAIWMLPSNYEYEQYPSNGEIDIMESVGYMPHTILSVLHTKLNEEKMKSHEPDTIIVEDCYTDFHVYAMEWTPDYIKTFVDDENFFTFKNKYDNSGDFPFTEAYHLLLNVAVGGTWGGREGIDESIFPQSMVIGYVRVYQKKE